MSHRDRSDRRVPPPSPDGWAARDLHDDPILRYIDPAGAPTSFLVASPEEQAWRGRLYLATWVLSHHEAYSWAIALADDDTGDTRRVVDGLDDSKLLAGLCGASLDDV